MIVALFQIGKFWDTAEVVKVFSSFEKAKENIPKGFKCRPVVGYDYYADNKKKEKWLTIKCYEVDEIPNNK